MKQGIADELNTAKGLVGLEQIKGGAMKWVTAITLSFWAVQPLPGAAAGTTEQAGQSPSGTVVRKRMTPQEAQDLLNKIPGMHFAKGIPTNFPVPTYPNNVTRTGFINSTKGPPSAGATIITKDSPQTVFNWYQNACKQGNWLVKIPSPQAMNAISKKQRVYMVNAEKDNQQVQIFCIENKKDSGTKISISWRKK
jgi:hypothetical protein